MSVRIPWLVRKPVIRHDLTADEGFEREGRQHVETETEARNIDHSVVCREVIEDVALGLVAKCQEARNSHGQAGQH